MVNVFSPFLKQNSWLDEEETVALCVVFFFFNMMTKGPRDLSFADPIYQVGSVPQIDEGCFHTTTVLNAPAVWQLTHKLEIQLHSLSWARLILSSKAQV